MTTEEGTYWVYAVTERRDGKSIEPTSESIMHRSCREAWHRLVEWAAMDDRSFSDYDIWSRWERLLDQSLEPTGVPFPRGAWERIEHPTDLQVPSA